mmetsp:Transcript_524/g.659  ORF Transcript_524/g.659 Transcript_524/m.659 type:complete len:215 (-) Transcript_524:2423-3067(-)
MLQHQSQLLEHVMETNGKTSLSHNKLTDAIIALSQGLKTQPKSSSTETISTKDNPQADHTKQQQPPPNQTESKNEQNDPNDIESPLNSTNSLSLPTTISAITTNLPATQSHIPTTIESNPPTPPVQYNENISKPLTRPSSPAYSRPNNVSILLQYDFQNSDKVINVSNYTHQVNNPGNAKQWIEEVRTALTAIVYLQTSPTKPNQHKLQCRSHR